MKIDPKSNNSIIDLPTQATKAKTILPIFNDQGIKIGYSNASINKGRITGKITKTTFWKHEKQLIARYKGIILKGFTAI